MQIIAREQRYRGYHGCASRCRLRVYQHGTTTVLLVSEIPENPGTSITNRAEALATALVRQYAQGPDWVWIEHYPPQGGLEERLHEVRFTWDERGRASNPQWERISREAVVALIGTDFSV